MSNYPDSYTGVEDAGVECVHDWDLVAASINHATKGMWLRAPCLVCKRFGILVIDPDDIDLEDE